MRAHPFFDKGTDFLFSFFWTAQFIIYSCGPRKRNTEIKFLLFVPQYAGYAHESTLAAPQSLRVLPHIGSGTKKIKNEQDAASWSQSD